MAQASITADDLAKVIGGHIPDRLIPVLQDQANACVDGKATKEGAELLVLCMPLLVQEVAVRREIARDSLELSDNVVRLTPRPRLISTPTEGGAA